MAGPLIIAVSTVFPVYRLSHWHFPPPNRSPAPAFPFPLLPAPARSQAERKEDERIQEFLRAVYDLEAEKAEVDKHFNDNYKLFVKLWKGIISEKKELNSQLKALDSARSSLRDKTKKVSRAEQKEPQYADFGVDFSRLPALLTLGITVPIFTMPNAVRQPKPLSLGTKSNNG